MPTASTTRTTSSRWSNGASATHSTCASARGSSTIRARLAIDIRPPDRNPVLRVVDRANVGARVTDPTSGFRCLGPRAWRRFADSYPEDFPEPESLFWCARKWFAGGRTAGANVRATGRGLVDPKAESGVLHGEGFARDPVRPDPPDRSRPRRSPADRMINAEFLMLARRVRGVRDDPVLGPRPRAPRALRHRLARGRDAALADRAVPGRPQNARRLGPPQLPGPGSVRGARAHLHELVLHLGGADASITGGMCG